MATTTRPASTEEIASTAAKPVHKQVVEVEENTDGRATVGKAKTIHRAHVTTYLNSYGESVGSITTVACGAERYRNGRSSATKTSSRYAVDCDKCLKH